MSHHLNDTYLSSTNIYLNSDFADESYSDNHKVFYLDHTIEPPSNIQLLVGLSQLEVPYSFYNVNANNNKFVFSTTNGTFIIELDEGNYDTDRISTILNQKLYDIRDEVGATLTLSFNEYNYLFSFDSSIDFIIEEATTMNKLLGLKNQLPTPSSKTYTAQNVCNLAGLSSFYVQLNNLSLNNILNGRTSNIVAKVDVNVEFGNYVYYLPSEVLYFILNDKSIKKLDISLIDEDYQPLDMNGSSFNLVLSIHYSYIREVKFNQFRLFNENENKKSN